MTDEVHEDMDMEVNNENETKTQEDVTASEEEIDATSDNASKGKDATMETEVQSKTLRNRESGGRGTGRQGRGAGCGRGPRPSSNCKGKDSATDEKEASTVENAANGEGNPDAEDDEAYDGDPDDLEFGSFAKRQTKLKDSRAPKSQPRTKKIQNTPKLPDEFQANFARTMELQDALFMAITKKESRIGIQLNRVETFSKVTMYSEKFNELGKIIAKIDPLAVILPHDNSTSRAMTIQEFVNKPSMDFISYFDSHAEKWGHPREDKFRLVFSFYIATDIISFNLQQLREDDSIKEFLQTNGLSMTPHTLHESRDESIGFLLGKSQQFTWTGDIATRLKQHLFNELKTNIEVALKPRTVKVDDVQANVLTLFVGKEDAKIVEETLTKHPFPEIDVVMYSLKRKGSDSYKTQLQIHNSIVDNSRAIKLCNVDEIFEFQLRNACTKDDNARMRIVDFAKYKKSTADMILYVQCHEVHKEWVHEWVTTQINKVIAAEEEQAIPYIATPNKPGSKTSTKHKNQDVQASYESRFHYMWNNKQFQTNDSKSTRSAPARWKIPPAIAVSNVSYASVAGGGDRGRSSSSQQSDHSSVSSPDRSTTSSMKTKREIELEEIVEDLNKKNQLLDDTNKELQKELSNFKLQFEKALEKTTESTKACESMRSELTFERTARLEFEQQTRQDRLEFEQQTRQDRLEFEEKFARMENLLLKQFNLSPEDQEQSQSLSPHGDRKRRNVRSTPNKIKMSRELRNLQSRRGDIWNEAEQDQAMDDSSPETRQPLPAEAPPHDAGVSANTK